MSTLADRLESKPFKPNQRPVKGQAQTVASQYALSKVVERLMGGAQKASQSKFGDNYHFVTLRNIDPDQRTREQQAELNRGKADLHLIATEKGVLRVVSHEQFEEYWNLKSEQARASMHIVREFWLGKSFEINLRSLPNDTETAIEMANRLISERLLADIVSFVEDYKSNPVGSKKLRGRGKEEFEIDKGSWMERIYYGWSKVGLQYTTYLLPLIESLADGLGVPADMPDTVLNESEKAFLNNRFKPQKESKTETKGKDN